MRELVRYSMDRQGFGVSLQKNKAAVRTLPTDFVGSEYFAPNMSLQRLSLEDYARGGERRLAECRRLIGF